MSDEKNEFGYPAEFRGEYHDSQTQAAWAAYFTAAGMPYVTEPETFHLKVISKLYTPDFFLPEQDTYVEVKNGRISWIDCYKLATVARGTGKMALLLDGMPRNMAAYFFGSDSKNFPPATGNYPQKGFSDMQLYAWQTRPSNSSSLTLPFAEAITQLMQVSRSGWSTKISNELGDAHYQKKLALRDNLRVI